LVKEESGFPPAGQVVFNVAVLCNDSWKGFYKTEYHVGDNISAQTLFCSELDINKGCARVQALDEQIKQLKQTIVEIVLQKPTLGDVIRELAIVHCKLSNCSYMDLLGLLGQTAQLHVLNYSLH
jgi:hypothetical protein